MALTDADLDRISNWPVDSDVPALVAEIRRLRTALHQIARVEADNARLRDFLQLIVEEVDKGRAVNVRGVAVHALHSAADVPREQE